MLLLMIMQLDGRLNVSKNAQELLLYIAHLSANGFKLVNRAIKAVSKEENTQPYSQITALIENTDVFDIHMNAVTLINTLIAKAPDSYKRAKLVARLQAIGISKIIQRRICGSHLSQSSSPTAVVHGCPCRCQTQTDAPPPPPPPPPSPPSALLRPCAAEASWAFRNQINKFQELTNVVIPKSWLENERLKEQLEKASVAVKHMEEENKALVDRIRRLETGEDDSSGVTYGVSASEAISRIKVRAPRLFMLLLSAAVAARV